MTTTTKTFIRNFTSILNMRSLILSIAAVLSTYLCIKFGIRANFPMALVGTAVIFPIVFSINEAYNRREYALRHYGEIKAHLRSIYYALILWHQAEDEQKQTEYAKFLSAPLHAIKVMLTGSRTKQNDNEKFVYAEFHHIVVLIEQKGRKFNYAGGEIGACNRFLNMAMSEFEKLKHIYEYRTPRSLQAFSDVFITILPVLYGPVFAHLGVEENVDSNARSSFFVYFVPALFAFILSSLDNIQAHLEDPFDGIGVDDLVIHANKFESTLGSRRVEEAGELRA